MAQGKKFTDQYIRSLKGLDKPKEYLEPTPAYRGSFGIRVSKTGTKSFFVYYKGQGGKQRRMTIGSYGGIGLADARKKAYQILADAENGIDPVAENKQGRTFVALWDMYSKSKEFTTNRQTGLPKAESTIYEQHRKWEKIVRPAWGDKLVKDVTRSDINDLLASVPPAQGNHLHSHLSVMFTKAVDLEWIDLHPMYKLKLPHIPVERDRVLEGPEITALWKALHDPKVNLMGRDAMKLMLLTGQRSGEILAMKFEDIDEEWNWHQPTNKNRSHHVIPLNRQSIEVIIGRRNLGDGIHVFFEPSTGRSVKKVRRQRINANHVMGYCDFDGNLTDDYTEDKRWTEHDLRRSARTLMGRLGIPSDIAERVLGHAVGKIQRIYNKYEYLDEKRKALQKLGNEIDRLTGKGPKVKQKVVQMRMFNG